MPAHSAINADTRGTYVPGNGVFGKRKASGSTGCSLHAERTRGRTKLVESQVLVRLTPEASNP